MPNPHGSVDGRQVRIKPDGIYFGLDPHNPQPGDWRVVQNETGNLIVETAATANFATVTKYQDFNPTSAVIETPQGWRASHTTVSANYTAAVGDFTIECNASDGAFTVTLMPVATAGSGFMLSIGKSDSTNNVVTIDGSGSETINGKTNYLLSMPYQGVTIGSNGTSWRVTNEMKAEGGSKGAHTSVTTTYTVTSQDRFIGANATAGAFTITLPAAAIVGSGFIVGIGKEDATANAVTIDGNSTETIGGSQTYVLNIRYQGIEIESNGTNWNIIHSFPGEVHSCTSTAPFEATVASGATFVAVTHSRPYTPHASEIHVIPTNNLGSAAKWWIDTIGATTFRINTNVDPGVGGATFAWKII